MPLVHRFDLYLLVVIALIELAAASGSRLFRRWLVAVISFAAYHLSRGKRQLIEKNLQSAFGAALDPHTQAVVTKQIFQAFWRETFDWVLVVTDASLPRVQIKGIEQLRAAIELGQGAILWESNSLGPRLLS